MFYSIFFLLYFDLVLFNLHTFRMILLLCVCVCVSVWQQCAYVFDPIEKWMHLQLTRKFMDNEQLPRHERNERKKYIIYIAIWAQCAHDVWQ